MITKAKNAAFKSWQGFPLTGLNLWWPFWAPWQPVVWNTELNAWGVWWNGSFQTL